MNICVFDTETTSLDKPFCYNIGYVIYNTEEDCITLKKEFIVEQVWHNPMLYTTAYYSNKKPIYINRMRAKKITMDKFGYICQEMIRDFKAFNVTMAFAYNSSFDEKVFDFNCDWFKCINPFDNVEIKDIRGFVHKFIIDDEYKQWCEKVNAFSDSGNYSTTAENVYRYLIDDDFIEEHTALSDSIAELSILNCCIDSGADYNDNYVALKSIERKISKHWTISKDKKEIFSFDCYNMTVSKTKQKITIK